MIRVRLSLRLHRTLGLWTGGVVFLVALTGSLLVFRPELSRLLYPEVFASRACERSVTLGELTLRVATARPDVDLIYVEDMQTPCLNAFAVALPHDARGAPEPQMLGMDPASGEAAGVMPLGANVLNFALILHTTLLAGTRGRWLVGLVGASLALIVVMGVFAWSAGQSRRLRTHLRRTLRVRRRHLAYDSHRATGVVIALLLVVAALTGVSMAFERQLQPVSVLLSGAPDAPTAGNLAERSGAAPAPGALDIAGAIVLAERLLPESRPASAGYAGANAEFVYVRSRFAGDNFLYGRSIIYFDRRTARALAVVDSRDAPASWYIVREAAWTLHTGAALGTAGRTAMLCAGVGAAALFLLGVSMWWKRTRPTARRPDR